MNSLDIYYKYLKHSLVNVGKGKEINVNLINTYNKNHNIYPLILQPTYMNGTIPINEINKLATAIAELIKKIRKMRATKSNPVPSSGPSAPSRPPLAPSPPASTPPAPTRIASQPLRIASSTRIASPALPPALPPASAPVSVSRSSASASVSRSSAPVSAKFTVDERVIITNHDTYNDESGTITTVPLTSENPHYRVILDKSPDAEIFFKETNLRTMKGEPIDETTKLIFNDPDPDVSMGNPATVFTKALKSIKDDKLSVELFPSESDINVSDILSKDNMSGSISSNEDFKLIGKSVVIKVDGQIGTIISSGDDVGNKTYSVQFDDNSIKTYNINDFYINKFNKNDNVKIINDYGDLHMGDIGVVNKVYQDGMYHIMVNDKQHYAHQNNMELLQKPGLLSASLSLTPNNNFIVGDYVLVNDDKINIMKFSEYKNNSPTSKKRDNRGFNKFSGTIHKINTIGQDVYYDILDDTKQSIVIMAQDIQRTERPSKRPSWNNVHVGDTVFFKKNNNQLGGVVQHIIVDDADKTKIIKYTVKVGDSTYDAHPYDMLIQHIPL